MYEVIVGASYGALTGIGWSLIGYFGAKSGEDKTSFDFKGLGKGMLAGGLAGATLGFGGVEITGYEQLMQVTVANISVVALSQKILHIGYNLLERAKKFLSK